VKDKVVLLFAEPHAGFFDGVAVGDAEKGDGHEEGRGYRE